MMEGFNSFIDEQKKVAGEAMVSMYQFDDEYEVLFENKNLQKVDKLTDSTFSPRGMTALLDAVGKTVQNVKTKDVDQTVVLIITDGEENASKEFKLNQIKKLIKDKESEDWQFVYVGANQDAFQVGQSIGIGSTMDYQADSQGTRTAYAALSTNMTSTRTKGLRQNYFEDDSK